ncbi:MAG: ATP-binding cassette domain-containing protein [Merdibacter sp.]
MSTLTVKDLHVQVEDKEILKGIDLVVNEGETHALMGPNGNGKSTLLSAIMGNPRYKVTKERSCWMERMSGRWRSMSAARPVCSGDAVSQRDQRCDHPDFLRTAVNARRERPIPLFTFIRQMEKAIEQLQMKEDLAHRF